MKTKKLHDLLEALKISHFNGPVQRTVFQLVEALCAIKNCESADLTLREVISCIEAVQIEYNAETELLHPGLTATPLSVLQSNQPGAKAVSTPTALPKAQDFLRAGIKHMEDRAVTYDKADGERSMGKTVAAYNIITDQNMTEEHGWLFLGVLKKVRSQQGAYRADNYEDDASYSGLRGECAARDRV